MAPGNTPALTLLRDLQVQHHVHHYELESESDTYGEAVAEALGVIPDRLFKTLVASVDERPVVGLVPVSMRLSLKALARVGGGKRSAMMEPGQAERLTGYVTGGISPFGQKRLLPTYVDASMMDSDTIYASGGRRGIQVEVAPGDLIRVLGAEVSPIASD